MSGVPIVAVGGYGSRLVDEYLKRKSEMFFGPLGWISHKFRSIYFENKIDEIYKSFLRAVWIDRSDVGTQKENKRSDEEKNILVCENCNNPDKFENCNCKRCYIKLQYLKLINEDLQLNVSRGFMHCPEIHKYWLEKIRSIQNWLFGKVETIEGKITNHIKKYYLGDKENSDISFWIFVLGFGGGIGSGLITRIAESQGCIAIASLTELKEREGQQAPFIKRAFNTMFTLNDLIGKNVNLILLDNTEKNIEDKIEKIIDTLMTYSIIALRREESPAKILENKFYAIPLIVKSIEEIEKVCSKLKNDFIKSAEGAIVFYSGYSYEQDKEIKNEIMKRICVNVNDIEIYKIKPIFKNQKYILILLKNPTLLYELLEKEYETENEFSEKIKNRILAAKIFSEFYKELLSKLEHNSSIDNLFNKIKNPVYNNLNLNEYLSKIQEKYSKGSPEGNFNNLKEIASEFEINFKYIIKKYLIETANINNYIYSLFKEFLNEIVKPTTENIFNLYDHLRLENDLCKKFIHNEEVDFNYEDFKAKKLYFKVKVKEGNEFKWKQANSDEDTEILDKNKIIKNVVKKIEKIKTEKGEIISIKTDIYKLIKENSDSDTSKIKKEHLKLTELKEEFEKLRIKQDEEKIREIVEKVLNEKQKKE